MSLIALVGGIGLFFIMRPYLATSIEGPPSSAAWRANASSSACW